MTCATAENCLSGLVKPEMHAVEMFGADVEGRQPAQVIPLGRVAFTQQPVLRSYDRTALTCGASLCTSVAGCRQGACTTATARLCLLIQ